MLKEERFNRILAILDENKFATVEELSKAVFVSPPTLRRYLAQMANRGLIVRSHGGAIAISEAAEEDPLLVHLGAKFSEKEAIAQRAADIVMDGSILFLDASSLSLAMADFLGEKKNLTIVTNNMPLINRLHGTGIGIYCCGGDFVESSSSFVGSIAVEVAEQFNYDAAFITCTALTPDGMMARNSVHSARLLRAVLRRSRCKVLLCDKEKIGKYAGINIDKVSSMDFVITDDRDTLREENVRIIRV